MPACPFCRTTVSMLLVREREKSFRVFLCFCGELGRVELKPARR